MNRSVPTAHSMFFSGTLIPDEQRERMERAFFSNIIARNGTFKTTNHRRLDDLNALAARHLPANRPLQIMDVAVSSGVSTAEWLESLQQAGVDVRMVAGDLFVDSFLVTVSERLRVLVDRTGHPQQFDIQGQAIPNPTGRRALVQHFFALHRLRAAARRVAPLLADQTQAPEQIAARIMSKTRMKVRALKLVSSSLLKLQHLQVVEDDILVHSPCVGTLDVLRAANILNRVYFDDATLTEMLCNLRKRLRPGGIFIICRTMDPDSVNQASVFRLGSDGRFEVLDRLNKGSEIEDLVLGLNL